MKYAINLFAAASLMAPLASQANTSKPVEITFKDLKWEIPAGSTSIEFFDNGQGEINVFYSDSSDKYLSIHPSKRNRNPEAGLNCWYADLLKDVFNQNKDTKCHKDTYKIFSKNFIEGSKTGTWEGNGNTVYFSESKEYTSLFVIINNHEVYRLESDFLSKDEMKNIVGKII